jgi:ATP-dependent RNA helicase DDX31/DBP7
LNKYEKRRAKARKARQEQNDADKSEVVTKEDSEGDKNEVAKEKVMEESVVINDDPLIESETIAKTDTLVQIAVSAARQEAKDVKENTPVLLEANPISTPSLKSRKVHSSSLLENEQERARYMREFHARPMEMDRRSGAIRGVDIAPSQDSTHLFDDSNKSNNGFASLHSRLQSSLDKIGIQQPTIIQTRAIQSLHKNRHSNLFVQSETGSGKTLAYLLPILQVRPFI